MTSTTTGKEESWDPEEYAITPSSFEIVAKEKVQIAKKGGKNKGNYDDDDDYDEQNPQRRRREDRNAMMPTLSEKMWEKLYGNTPKSMESLNAPWHAFLGEEEENAKEDRGSVDDGSGNQNQLMRQREKTDLSPTQRRRRLLCSTRTRLKP